MVRWMVFSKNVLTDRVQGHRMAKLNLLEQHAHRISAYLNRNMDSKMPFISFLFCRETGISLSSFIITVPPSLFKMPLTNWGLIKWDWCTRRKP